MDGLKNAGGGNGPVPTSEEIQARIGKRLDDVAKILAGALVAVAGVMTALGLNSEFVFVALNNESWPIYVASLCAIIAIVCSIVALLIHPTQRGNMWETVVLVLGVVFYMVSLSVAVIGAARAAGGNGRPTITDVKLEGPRSDLKLSFDVHADGVETWASLAVYVESVDARSEQLDGSDLYESSLRPNDKGVVEQRISLPISPPARAVGVAITALNAGEKDTEDNCQARTERGPACTTLRLPGS
ncbi:hypothetical protein [Streptomyces netropsis]|uniref:Uncharacterized protein n=1 Tax=Streptomyces netropsis TaxID=55404 RepID=A0A7W7PCA4_STRNE|nr:hypothetical protein [Streptomyces netropsis]MBB4884402.1 hypothetical protein [Streptomyces netropsis]GGR03933.1 hypothetical protein GCM10010219_05100 [Streptomyces netropsis]